MYNNSNTLTNYLILLKKYISEIAKINHITDNFLSSTTIANLYFEESGRRFFIELLGLNSSFSSSEKILILIKEISDQIKSHLYKFIIYNRVLEELIMIVSSK